MSEISTAQGAKNNSGYLYPNEKKNDRQPDFRGKVTIDGKEWWISGWRRTKDGVESISVALTDPATRKPEQGAAVSADQPAPVRPSSGSDAGSAQTVRNDFGDIFKDM